MLTDTLGAGSEPSDQVAVTVEEIVQLGARDTRLYGKFFFPKTVRQAPAPFHDDMDRIIEGPGRLKMLQVFRGGAKTTKLRIFLSKRIAYGISHTILVVGKSEGHAARSIKWIRNQVTFNRKWAQTFGLSRGVKWTDTECEILRMLPGMTEPERVTIVAMGITGSIRGINIDDWRPDLIILDDVLDEENSATPEQREKNEALIYGAIKNSLAPASEEPTAMLVALQTPLNREDYSVKSEHDPDWIFVRISCWTNETKDEPIEHQESAWPARFPSEVLRQEKLGFIRRNKLSVWLREMECKCASPETSSFRAEWLVRFTELPKFLTHILVIDPVPPPSPIQLSQGNALKDYEALGVIGGFAGKYYAREISVNRGHEPNWTVAEFWRLYAKYKPQWVIVEAIGYQRTLAWLLKQSMRLKGIYVPVQEFTDNGSKFYRITDGLSGSASHGALLIPPDDAPEGIQHSDGMRQFVQQFAEYPAVSHDDALEVIAVGLSAIAGKILLGDEHALEVEKALEQEDRRYFRHKEEVEDNGLRYAP